MENYFYIWCGTLSREGFLFFVETVWWLRCYERLLNYDELYVITFSVLTQWLRNFEKIL